jgi:biopolymer transport protein ExbB
MIIQSYPAIKAAVARFGTVPLLIIFLLVCTVPVKAQHQTDLTQSHSDAAPAATAAVANPQRAEPEQSVASRASMRTDLHELSPWSMFLAADILVKAVMLSLAFASLVTWSVFFAKSVELSSARRRLSAALAKIGEVRTLAEAQMALGSPKNVLGNLLAAAAHELLLSSDIKSDAGIKERAASSFSEIVRGEGRAMRRGTGLLATIGSTAPFVGLFGTVWGIMNSFIGISKSQTTNLAVVAPGIAEALLATAIGLVAAIPAVIIYNHFNRQTRSYLDLVGCAAGAATRLLSRDIDRQCGDKPRRVVT